MPTTQNSGREMTMTVTDDAPLMVVADGADTPCPAASTTGLTLALGDRVRVTIRTPQRPLVTGKVDNT